MNSGMPCIDTMPMNGLFDGMVRTQDNEPIKIFLGEGIGAAAGFNR